MSQSGFQPILIYASGTSGNTPAAANLQSTSNGAELAINYVDGKLFYKDGSGVVQTIATKSAANGNITWGSANQIPYQTAANTTSFITAPTIANTVLQWTTSGFVWANVSASGGSSASSNTANNIANGAANQLLYQTGANTTSFITAPTTASTYLQWNGSAFVWAAASGGSSANINATNGVISNANTVTSSYSVPSGSNVITVGPWTVANGVTFTLPSGSRQVIV
jgi:hypothetical protein